MTDKVSAAQVAGVAAAPVPTPYYGNWVLPWRGPVTTPAAMNLGLVASGSSDPAYAVQSSVSAVSSLRGTRFITLGGSGPDGSWTAAALTQVGNAVRAGTFTGYSGIAFDVQEGNAGLSNSFAQAFQVAKARGFKVLVTVSHTTPYGISDASALVTSFLQSVDIDLLSPQLYTTGTETKNDYTENPVKWTTWKTARAPIVPSLVSVATYQDAVTFFTKQGITIKGCLVWNV